MWSFRLWVMVAVSTWLLRCSQRLLVCCYGVFSVNQFYYSLLPWTTLMLHVTFAIKGTRWNPWRTPSDGFNKVLFLASSLRLLWQLSGPIGAESRLSAERTQWTTTQWIPRFRLQPSCLRWNGPAGPAWRMAADQDHLNFLSLPARRALFKLTGIGRQPFCLHIYINAKWCLFPVGLLEFSLSVALCACDASFIRTRFSFLLWSWWGFLWCTRVVLLADYSMTPRNRPAFHCLCALGRNSRTASDCISL